MSGITFAQAAADQNYAIDMLNKLWRRKLLIACTTIVLFGILFAGWQLVPRSYEATAKLAVDPTQTNLPIQGMITQQAFSDQSLGTETAVLDSVLPRVLVQLHLTEVPEFNPDLKRSLSARIAAKLPWIAPVTTPVLKWLHSFSGPPASVTPQQQQVADTLAVLQNKVNVAPEPRSQVIDVKVTSHDNVLAQRIANAIVQADLEVHRQFVNQTNVTAHDFFEKHLATLRQVANDANVKVEEYRAAHGLSDGKATTIIQQEASDTNEQLTKAQTKLAELQSEWASVRSGDANAMATVLGSQAVALLKERRATVELKLADLAETYGAGSTALLRWKAELRNIDSQLATETRRARTSLQNQLMAAQGTVAALTARMEKLKGQLATSTESRGDLATLLASAKQAETDYRTYAEAVTRTNVAMLFTLIPVRAIQEAATPTWPAFPNQIDYGMSGILALVGGCCLAGFLESRRKGMLSTFEVKSLTSLPVLAVVAYRDGSPKTEQMFRDGIAQLLNQLTDLQTPLSVLITSAKANEGKSTVAMALAEAASDAGFATLLVDADMRTKLTTTTTLGNAATCGLSDVLRGEIGIEQAIMRPTGKEVALVPAGIARSRNPNGLLALRGEGGKSRIQVAMNLLKPTDHEAANGKTTFDIIIVDAPPATMGGDCWNLSRSVDHTVIVTKWGVTKPEDVRLAVHQLTSARSDNETGGIKSGANVAGIVINMVMTDQAVKLGTPDAIMFDSKTYKNYLRIGNK